MFGTKEIVGLIIIIIGIAMMWWREYLSTTIGMENNIWVIIGIVAIIGGIWCMKNCMSKQSI